MGLNCGETTCDCIVRGRSYEQIRDTTSLTYLESTSRRGETYEEKQRLRAAYLAGMNQGTELFVPRGVWQAAACDENYYQIPQEQSEINPLIDSFAFRP